ncbi:MAG: hypothetical protein SFV52_10935 [Saprospiraceae bacterium]|nr:hypothetical protein [Saprospiraceae bacterium]
MDLLKAKIYLDKINREMTRMMRDPETIVRIEQDILLSYVRELYDALLPDYTSVASPAAPPPRKPAAHVAPKAEPVPPPVETPPPPVPEPPPAPAPPPPVFISPEISLAPPSSGGNAPAVEQLFAFKEARELSEKLANQPIADLKQALSLNDRLLYTRELFAGDQQAFEHAVNAVNTAAGFEHAKNYLISQCVNTFGWTDKSRLELAKKFVTLVRRRHP